MEIRQVEEKIKKSKSGTTKEGGKIQKKIFDCYIILSSFFEIGDSPSITD
jgi:hypothetical protein